MGVLLGAFLGFVNVVFVAFAMAWSDPSIPKETVVTVGLIPGVVTGTFLGLLADRMEDAPTWQRICALALPASGVVAFLGSIFELEGYIVLAWIPTVVGCCLLERATRKPPELPAARAES